MSNDTELKPTCGVCLLTKPTTQPLSLHVPLHQWVACGIVVDCASVYSVYHHRGTDHLNEPTLAVGVAMLDPPQTNSDHS